MLKVNKNYSIDYMKLLVGNIYNIPVGCNDKYYYNYNFLLYPKIN